MTAPQALLLALLLGVMAAFGWLTRDAYKSNHPVLAGGFAATLTMLTGVFALYASAVLGLGLTVEDIKALIEAGRAPE